MKLENERLSVEISEVGAEVTRIFDKKTQTDVLWEGDPAFWKRHSPILFPNVGKTYHNVVLINGTHYPTSQHGFARDGQFKCVCETVDKASFLLASSEESKEVYPFDFELIITYTLEEHALHVEWEVRNTGDEDMYFTIGGHPAFRFAGKDEVKTDYLLRFPGKDALEYIIVNEAEAAADPDTTFRLELDNECCGLSEELFDIDTLIFDHGQIDEVWLCHKDGTPYVGVKCEGFPNFGIWSMKNAPFVCLEPWMGRLDDVGFDREISEKPDINKAAAGGSFKQDYTILLP